MVGCVKAEAESRCRDLILSGSHPITIDGGPATSGARVGLHISAADGECVKPHEVQRRAWGHGIGIEGDLNDPGADRVPGTFSMLVLRLRPLRRHEERQRDRTDDY